MIALVNRLGQMHAEKQQIWDRINEAVAKIKALCSVDRVIIYGSLVRCDFWPGRSDVDIYLVGDDDSTKCSEKILKHSVPKAEVVRVQRGYFKEQCKKPFKERDIQLGLHGFDTVDCHKCLVGRDPLVDFLVARGVELIPLVEARLRDLASPEGRSQSDKPEKKAVEALKTAALLWSIKAGLKETRLKVELYERFQKYVPDFPLKSFSQELWKSYKTGTTIDRSKCADFIQQVVCL